MRRARRVRSTPTTDTFTRLPEQYQDNLISVADLIFVGRSMERMAEGLQKVVAEALYAAS